MPAPNEPALPGCVPPNGSDGPLFEGDVVVGVLLGPAVGGALLCVGLGELGAVVVGAFGAGVEDGPPLCVDVGADGALPDVELSVAPETVLGGTIGTWPGVLVLANACGGGFPPLCVATLAASATDALRTKMAAVASPVRSGQRADSQRL